MGTILFLIWAVSGIISSFLMMERYKKTTATLMLIAFSPVLNTIYVILQVYYSFRTVRLKNIIEILLDKDR